MQQPVAQALGLGARELAGEQQASGSSRAGRGRSARAGARRGCARSRGTAGCEGRCPCRCGCGPRRGRGRGGGARHRRSSPGWSVRIAWKRWPSWSVKDSCAPGCARSRRTITRDPAGQPVRSSSSVISQTCPLARSPPSWSKRANPALVGDLQDRGADRLGQVVADRVADRAVAAPVQQLVAGARRIDAQQDLDVLDVLGGNLLQACSATLIWSSAVFAPAFPGPQLAAKRLAGLDRSRPAAGESRSRP